MFHLRGMLRSHLTPNYLIGKAVDMGKGANVVVSMLHHFFEVLEVHDGNPLGLGLVAEDKPEFSWTR